MNLKTKVKVGNITNLSDARYCAGMGVDMLGFVANAESPHYVTPEFFKELKGWIEGPATVVQISDMKPSEMTWLSSYEPEFVEVLATNLESIPSSLPPLIVALKEETEIKLLGNHKIAYIQLPETELSWISKVPETLEILIELNSKKHLGALLDHPRVNGIVLNGTPEERPGFKSFDDLMEVLEELETD